MSAIDPVIHSRLITLSDQPPGMGRACGSPRRELARLEWRCAEAGDPLALLEAFLAGHGLPVSDLSAPGVDTHHRRERICGAAVLLGAHAAARVVGAAERPATPAPAVPDLVAVVYEHTTHPSAATERVQPWSVGPWRQSWTSTEHETAIEAVRAAIARGDVYQVNVVGHASAPYHGDPGPALRRVAALPGARHGGLLGGVGWAVACASPETLVEVREGRAVTRPIKGTRPATVEGRAQLLASEKERAEHVMIVDLERNDLATVAVTGTVRVDQLYVVTHWAGLWHAESTVSATLRPGTGLAVLLRAMCPGGSVTGAPKLAALSTIAALEPVGRGPSMGAFGWVGRDGVDFGLTIRTVAADAARIHLWAGGGVTWDSDAGEEVTEAAAKAAPLRATITAG